MKSVLISIQPKWCELIASGKKTVEVRKTRPKIKTPFKCYIYCTQGLFKDLGIIGNTMYEKRMKVIGEFVCKRITDIKPLGFDDIEKFEKQTCLNSADIVRYLKGFYGYGWHISDLVIYDKPKKLSEFWRADKCPFASEKGCTYEYHCFRAGQTKRCGSTLSRPPQSWCYVEGVDLQ